MIESILKLVLGLKCWSDSYHNMQIKIHHWSPQPLTMNVTISAKNFLKIAVIAFLWRHVTINWFLDISISSTRHRNQVLPTENLKLSVGIILYWGWSVEKDSLLYILSFGGYKTLLLIKLLISLNKKKKCRGSNIALFCCEIFLNIMKNDESNITQSKHNKYWVPSN